MSDREPMGAVSDGAAGDGEDAEPRQPPTLSEAEVEALTEELSIESLMEEPPQGDLAVISDEDVPGAPG